MEFNQQKFTLKNACAEIDDKLNDMSEKANFTERNRELILKIDKVTSEGLKASVSLADMMP